MIKQCSRCLTFNKFLKDPDVEFVWECYNCLRLEWIDESYLRLYCLMHNISFEEADIRLGNWEEKFAIPALYGTMVGV